MVDQQTRDASRSGVLFLLNSLAVGGSELKVLRIVNAMHRRDRPVHIAHLQGPETLRAQIDERVPVLPLGRRGAFSIRAFGRLSKYLDRQRVGRVVAVNLYPLIYCSLAAVFRRVDVVAMVNTSVHRTARDQRFMMLYAPLLRRASRVVFGSARQQADWVQEYRLHADRCVCIWNGVDAARFSPIVHPGVPLALKHELSGRFVIGTLGALRAEKAHEHLLTAAAVLRREGLPVAVLIVGDGPCRAALERHAKSVNMADVTVLHPNVTDPRPLLALMDVFAMTSVSVETFSNAALEAMSMAKPVVLSDVGGAREMVTPDVSGMVYTPGNLEELQGCLRRFYHDPRLRLSMGTMARRRILHGFSFGRMLADYERWIFQA